MANLLRNRKCDCGKKARYSVFPETSKRFHERPESEAEFNLCAKCVKDYLGGPFRIVRLTPNVVRIQ